MDDYYNSISEGYEELHKAEQEKKIEIIKKQLPKFFKIKKMHTLLDVGCGTGITTIPWNCKTTGLDPAKKLLEKAHNKDKINYINATAENIPFKNNEFNIITSITAIQNFQDIDKGLDEIKRVGKDFFILSFLKKSQKHELINNLIHKRFNIIFKIEEKKDMIYFCTKD